MKKNSAFSFRTWGFKEIALRFVEEAILKQIPLIRNEEGEIDEIKLKKVMMSVDFFHNLINWKKIKKEHTDEEEWLNERLDNGCTPEEIFWIMERKARLYLKITNIGFPSFFEEEEGRGEVLPSGNIIMPDGSVIETGGKPDGVLDENGKHEDFK